LVAGIGSYLSSDDEIGLALVEAFADRPHGLPSTGNQIATALWSDADALTLADELVNLATPVLLVDCADMRLPGGSWRLLSAEKAKLDGPVRALSTHGLGLIDALRMARELGCEQRVHFFGVQPFDLAPRRGLSERMQGLFADLLDALALSVDSLVSGREHSSTQSVSGLSKPVCRSLAGKGDIGR
jgi:hydrogenase maturation protease